MHLLTLTYFYFFDQTTYSVCSCPQRCQIGKERMEEEKEEEDQVTREVDYVMEEEKGVENEWKEKDGLIRT